MTIRYLIATTFLVCGAFLLIAARQVARDIFELREDNRAFSCYAVPVKYEVFLCYVKSFTFCTLIGSFRLLV